MSCTQPPDIPACVEIEKDKTGYCINTISDKEVIIEGEEWLKIKTESLIVPAKSWAKLKAFILKVCKQHKQCAEDIGSWERKTQKIDEKLNKE